MGEAVGLCRAGQGAEKRSESDDQATGKVGARSSRALRPLGLAHRAKSAGCIDLAAHRSQRIARGRVRMDGVSRGRE